MTPKAKKSLWKNIIQFVKLQLASNVLFWGTYVGYAIGDKLVRAESWKAIAVASILAHVLFFAINKKWVFNTKVGQAKTRVEMLRFLLFMGLNFFINIGIVLAFEKYLNISPYISQFIAAGFFTVWNWAGLKFWVFRHAK